MLRAAADPPTTSGQPLRRVSCLSFPLAYETPKCRTWLSRTYTHVHTHIHTRPRLNLHQDTSRASNCLPFFFFAPLLFIQKWGSYQVVSLDAINGIVTKWKSKFQEIATVLRSPSVFSPP